MDKESIKKIGGATRKAKNKTQINHIFALQKSAIKNAINMYHTKTDIINAFVNKDIYFVDVEKGVYYKSEESESKFEQSIAERTKMRREKSDQKKYCK